MELELEVYKNILKWFKHMLKIDEGRLTPEVLYRIEIGGAREKGRL